MATLIRRVNSLVSLAPAQLCYSFRHDNPYLTQDEAITTIKFTNQLVPGHRAVGKFSEGGGPMRRLRLGAAFLKSALAAASSVQLVVDGDDWVNVLEAWTPRVYLSNTNDEGLYSTGVHVKPLWDWEANLNNDLGVMQYNVIEQRVTINPSLIAAVAGTYVCVVIGQNLEMTNAGLPANLADAYFWPRVNIEYS